MKLAKPPQLLRKRENNMEVFHRKDLRFARLNPPSLRETLTLWTMPVATRIVRNGCLAASATSFTMATKRRRTALHNGVDGTPLNMSGAMRSQIAAAMASKNFRHVPTRACATAPNAWVLMHDDSSCR
ncbi:MAG: hypothetical protein SF187_20580 [Deltaproteobacteria bacterium]|nr:hypothetical protein [Deltaproteobacteria bacterium]